MKKAIYLLLLILSINDLNSQEYASIPMDTTSHWKVDGYYMQGMECLFEYSFWYYIQGEEIINNKTYSKLYSKGHWYEDPIWPGDPGCDGEGDIVDIYVGALRTENNIVYFKPYDWDSEQLLFDYNLNIGDTLSDTTFFLFGNNPMVTVSSIDSVLNQNGDYLKRWNLQVDGWKEQDWFIEGIGTNKGLFHELIPFEWDSELICYSENFLPVYPPGSDCDPTVGIFDQELITLDFICYPNPTNEFINIQISNPQAEKYFVEIYNITGQRIYSEEMESSASYSINCVNMKAGIYFIILSSPTEIKTTQKLLIN